jgi:pimeloyl-ACP methyl ester carboxylesterase
MRKQITKIVTAILLTAAILSTVALTEFRANAQATNSNWNLTAIQGVKAYPNLQEYIWQENASTAPHGPYDIIALHRLVDNHTTTKGVVFVLPGIYANGQALTTNPPTSNFTKTENSSCCIYWANRGFDVYTIDYRTHFIPNSLNNSDLSFMANWTLDMFINDIKEAITQAKGVSGAQKLFLAGQSLGGTWAQTYASKYWQDDLTGLILLDPASNATTVKPAVLPGTYNLTVDIAKMNTYGNWSWENPQQTYSPYALNPGYLSLFQLAAQNPGAPAQYPNGTLITTLNPRTSRTWANITEWLEYTFNTGKNYNTYGGYSNATIAINFAAEGDRYFPVRPFLDGLTMSSWQTSPFLPYDYMAHMREINVPLLAFRSELLGIPSYGPVVNNMATNDFTYVMLSNYGHGDVNRGTYSARDVYEPTLQWMTNHTTAQPTATPTQTATPTPYVPTTQSPTPSPRPTIRPTPTPSSTQCPTPTPTQVPEITPTPTPKTSPALAADQITTLAIIGIAVVIIIAAIAIAVKLRGS